MTGTETISALRVLLGPTSSTRIVGASANDFAAAHVAAGADLFWRKPLPTAAKMAQILRSLLPLPAASWRILVADDNPASPSIKGNSLKFNKEPHCCSHILK